MIKHFAAEEARERFAELVNEVRASGNPVIVEEQGQVVVALIGPADLADRERLRFQRNQDEFTRGLMVDARGAPPSDDTEEDVVRQVKATRRQLFRERYGDDPSWYSAPQGGHPLANSEMGDFLATR